MYDLTETDVRTSARSARDNGHDTLADELERLADTIITTDAATWSRLDLTEVQHGDLTAHDMGRDAVHASG